MMKRMPKTIVIVSLCIIPAALFAAGFRRSKIVPRHNKPKSYFKIPDMYKRSSDAKIRKVAKMMRKQQAKKNKPLLPERLEALQSKKYYKKDFPVLGLTYSKNLMVGTLDVFDDDVSLPLSGHERDYQQFLGKKFGSDIEKAEIPSLYVSWVNSLVGHGVFTDKAFKKGNFVCECTGHILPTNRVSAQNESLFHYPCDNPARSFVIDTSKEANFMRFVNHNKQGNLEAEYVQHRGLWHLVFVAKKDIARDELLTVDYGNDFWDGRRRPLKLG